jgi:hypothetical protein
MDNIFDNFEFEKNDLDSHVGMCTVRYRYLHEQITKVDDELKIVKAMATEIVDALGEMKDKHNDQLLSWFTAIIGTLLSVIGILVYKFILPMAINGHK